MKKTRLTYEEWTCIHSKRISGITVNTKRFYGYLGLIYIEEVDEPQIWKFNGEEIVVCNKGLKWLTILPKNEYYCITAMMDENSEIVLWYIDMIASQGIEDGIYKCQAKNVHFRSFKNVQMCYSISSFIYSFNRYDFPTILTT